MLKRKKKRNIKTRLIAAQTSCVRFGFWNFFFFASKINHVRNIYYNKFYFSEVFLLSLVDPNYVHRKVSNIFPIKFLKPYGKDEEENIDEKKKYIYPTDEPEVCNNFIDIFMKFFMDVTYFSLVQVFKFLTENMR